MSASTYPYLFATLGDAANQLPAPIARALETTLAATQATPTTDGPTLQACLQRIRQVDAADGQPWPGKGRSPGQRMALARIDRATAGLIFLLELLHASERVRVDGNDAQPLGDHARERLLLACRGLSEYVEVQLPAA
ncbi:hypothetical protein [Stenotrophomonas tuberculopleuritidis]|uniref:hypothetical protein n=1 Tax=Stenotrophomonas tuberculopleuritidis TaxID=3055079 RepID=UPI0026E56315|nr:hypothetical protein [Stenotrophomonas sp. 704A1]